MSVRKICNAIRENVGEPQPPLVSAGALWTVVCANGPVPIGRATENMDDAIEAGDVFRWTDGDGTIRYGLTDQGLDSVTAGSPYGPEDVPAINQCIETEASRENPDAEFIGWCNRRLAEVRDS